MENKLKESRRTLFQKTENINKEIELEILELKSTKTENENSLEDFNNRLTIRINI